MLARCVQQRALHGCLLERLRQFSSGDLSKQLQSRILLRGSPLTVAEYMQEVLTNPVGGFYMHKDVFGQRGDFTTAPEISQMFGEMLGVWCVCTWQQLGSPPAVRLVELGPGRGTLMADLLRATAGFKVFSAGLRVSLVEVSQHLREAQWRALRCTPAPSGLSAQAASEAAPADSQQPDVKPQVQGSREQPGSTADDAPSLGDVVQEGVSGWNGALVSWHRSLDAVPQDVPPLLLAHEFFDALPAHQFVRDPARGWLERLVDIQEGSEHATEAPPLRFVLSPSATPAVHLLANRRLRAMDAEAAEKLQALEVSAHAMAAAEALALRVARGGGAALVMDYGQDAPYGQSLNAIRAHKAVDVLSEPGMADLSCWVDFSALRAAASGCGAPVRVLGPVTQRRLLLDLGMEARLHALLQSPGITAEQAAALQSQFQRLTGEGDEDMGLTYKALALVPACAEAPVGFHEAASHVAEAS